MAHARRVEMLVAACGDFDRAETILCGWMSGVILRIEKQMMASTYRGARALVGSQAVHLVDEHIDNMTWQSDTYKETPPAHERVNRTYKSTRNAPKNGFSEGIAISHQRQ